MFRNLYDFLSGRGGPPPVPAYTITRLVGGVPRHALPGVTRHTYDIPSATDFIQFRAAYLMDLLGNPVVQRQVELILRDYMRFSAIRERYVLVRVGNWLGEFTVAENSADRGTLFLEASLERIP